MPDALDDRAGDYWGGSPVRRLVALLVTWTNLAVDLLTEAGDAKGASVLLAGKGELGKIRDEADRFAPIEAIDALLLEEMAARPGDPAGALRRRAAPVVGGRRRPVGSTDWSSGSPRASAPSSRTVRPHVSADPTEAARTMAGLVRLYDGAGPAGTGRLLLGFEVVEMAFGPADPPPDQTIRLAHFTADQSVTMDPAKRDDPDEKLAGVQLGHFAAFLKRSWRANDWMWGRLDAAERLVRLLDDATEHQLTRTDDSSTTSGPCSRPCCATCCRSWPPRSRPTAGSEPTSPTRHARSPTAVKAAGTPGARRTAGRVSLAEVDSERLEELLALNLVGVERLAGEVGMPHIGGLMLNAATTTAALLRHRGTPGHQRARPGAVLDVDRSPGAGASCRSTPAA